MSETVTAHAVRVGEKSQQPDGASVRSKDESRGGSAARSTLSPDNGKREGSQESQQNRAVSSRPRASRGRAEEVESAFIPILPADIAAGQSRDSVFHFLGSKTDPILHVQYPSPWNHVADFAAKSGEIPENSNWRRGGDSNPRYTFGVHGISSAAPSATRSPLHRFHGLSPAAQNESRRYLTDMRISSQLSPDSQLGVHDGFLILIRKVLLFCILQAKCHRP